MGSVLFMGGYSMDRKKNIFVIIGAGIVIVPLIICAILYIVYNRTHTPEKKWNEYVVLLQNKEYDKIYSNFIILFIILSLSIMAERRGFEPLIELLLYTLSRRAPSTSRTSLHLELFY